MGRVRKNIIFIAVALLCFVLWLLFRAGAVLHSGPSLPSGKVVPQLASSFGSAVLLAPDGSLWTWGEESTMLHLRGVSNRANLPQRMGSDSDWSRLALGMEHIAALRRDGTLWRWGTMPAANPMETN